jgi:hypothetical protein
VVPAVYMFIGADHSALHATQTAGQAQLEA